MRIGVTLFPALLLGCGGGDAKKDGSQSTSDGAVAVETSGLPGDVAPGDARARQGEAGTDAADAAASCESLLERYEFEAHKARACSAAEECLGTLSAPLDCPCPRPAKKEADHSLLDQMADEYASSSCDSPRACPGGECATGLPDCVQGLCSWTSPDCATLDSLYDKAVTGARHCTAAYQCEAARPRSFDCFCPVRLNKEANLAYMAAVWAFANEQGCLAETCAPQSCATQQGIPWCGDDGVCTTRVPDDPL